MTEIKGVWNYRHRLDRFQRLLSVNFLILLKGSFGCDVFDFQFFREQYSLLLLTHKRIVCFSKIFNRKRLRS
jgi:hypothetical protein